MNYARKLVEGSLEVEDVEIEVRIYVCIVEYMENFVVSQVCSHSSNACLLLKF